MSMDGYFTGLVSLTSASAVDQLQSALKQKEGELHNVQVTNTECVYYIVENIGEFRENLMNGLIIANGYERVHKFEEESCNLPNSPMFYPVLYDRVNIPFSWKYWCGNKVGSVVI